MAAHKAISSDCAAIAWEEWGSPAGREILFIHGFNQCRLSWLRQFTDVALAGRYRMIAMDLRGHGESDKPLDANSYAADKLWGDDVASVLAAAGLKRPAFVVWSYAGRVIADYFRAHGAGAIGGVNFVAARTYVERSMLGPGQQNLGAMKSPDLAQNIAATRAFLRSCFEVQPAQEDFETMLAFNMIVPAAVRTAVLARGPDTPDAFRALDCPALVTHGAKDQVLLPALSEFTASCVKGARLSIYEGIGHAPFWEDAGRFNRELAEFMDSLPAASGSE
jgi:non-heme chloroperoxidase